MAVKNKVTEITRRDIVDLLKIGLEDIEYGSKYDYYEKEYVEEVIVITKLSTYGRITEIDFLDRLYKLDELPSYDHRFNCASDDIHQHTVYNQDWEFFWVYTDKRFNIMNGSDENFLNFICEIFHPVVRIETEPWKKFLDKFNELLKHDGYELYPKKHISGRSVYAWREISSAKQVIKNQLSKIKVNFNSEYIDIQVNTMYESIGKAPHLAIGKAKELLETCCKTILDERDIKYSKDITLIQIMKMVCISLDLIPQKSEGMTDIQRISNKILGNLTNISQGMAELRNLFGDGHGKNKNFKTLPPRYAQLAVGTSVATVHFLWDTYLIRIKEN